MAPKISPGKTWSGLLGGSICAGGVGVVAAVISGQSTLFTFAVLGVVLGLAAQAGDLIESALKRRYNVKDSGTLIPGHGGVLDRLDGFLTAAPLAGLIVWINGGSPFTWT
jgi:phosphatidate cytidylyltransferase